MLIFAVMSATLQLLAGPKEDEAMRSLHDATGSVRIVCSPGLQTIPAGIVRLVGTDNAALKIKVDSLPKEEIDSEMAGGRASFALVHAPVLAPTVGITMRPLATKGLLFAVNATSGPTNLSKKDLDKVLAGKVADWSELGMPKGPLRVYVTPDRLPKEFEPAFAPEDEEEAEEPAKDADGKPVKRKKHNKNPFLRRFVPVSDEAKALSLVAQDPCGITAVNITSKAPQGARFISVDEVLPGPESYRAGVYPYARRIFMATPAKFGGPEAKIALLLLSEEFKAELLEQGLLPIEKTEVK